MEKKQFVIYQESHTPSEGQPLTEMVMEKIGPEVVGRYGFSILLDNMALAAGDLYVKYHIAEFPEDALIFKQIKEELFKCSHIVGRLLAKGTPDIERYMNALAQKRDPRAVEPHVFAR